MKGGGGSSRAWDPRGRGDPLLPPYPFICLWSARATCLLKRKSAFLYFLFHPLLSNPFMVFSPEAPRRNVTCSITCALDRKGESVDSITIVFWHELCLFYG